MNKAEVILLAEKLEMAREVVKGHGIMNIAGKTVSERVSMAAAFQIAKDQERDADGRYGAAFQQWKNEGYPE